MRINDSFIDEKEKEKEKQEEQEEQENQEKQKKQKKQENPIKQENQKKVEIRQNENQNVQEVQNVCCWKTSTNYFDKNKNLSFGLTFIGRLCMTLYSFHGLFFIYNIIILYIVIIPGFLFETESLFWKIVLSAIFICFAFSCSNLLLIPTFEFLIIIFLLYFQTKTI